MREELHTRLTASRAVRALYAAPDGECRSAPAEMWLSYTSRSFSFVRSHSRVMPSGWSALGSRVTADAHAHAQMHQWPPALTTEERSFASWVAEARRNSSDMVTQTSWYPWSSGAQLHEPERVQPVVEPSFDCVHDLSAAAMAIRQQPAVRHQLLHPLNLIRILVESLLLPSCQVLPAPKVAACACALGLPAASATRAIRARRAGFVVPSF